MNTVERNLFNAAIGLARALKQRDRALRSTDRAKDDVAPQMMMNFRDAQRKVDRRSKALMGMYGEYEKRKK